MSIFGSILQKLGIGTATAAPGNNPGTAPPRTTTPAAAATRPGAVTADAAPVAAMKPMEMVDVTERLEKRAAASPQRLEWKTSIVDLLKLLDLDSSFAARKELATELGCPAELMTDSAKMNVWLHRTVLQKIADNGGYLPPELIS